MDHRSVNVLIALPDFPEGMGRVRAVLGDTPFERIDPYGPSATLPTELIADRTVLVAEHAPLNFEEMMQLRWFQLGSAGYQQIAGLPLRSRGIQVTNASGVNDVPIAEWCLLMLLLFERDLPAILQLREQRAWDRRAKFQAELRGKRVGIVGYGGIGREVARLCRAAGLEIWVVSRSPVGPRTLRFAPAGTGDPNGTLPNRVFGAHELDQFLPHLDYLILTASLTPQSRGLIGERELRLLPPTAILLNPARALLVDESALYRALGEGWIAGAALDVHYREPLAVDDPIWAVPNVVVTPHISGSAGSPYYQHRLWELVALNLERHLTGQPLLNEISWADLDAR